MRKFLLASTAVLGATMGLANTAGAQTFSNSESYENSAYGTGDAYATPGSVTVRLNGRFRFFGGVTAGSVRKTNFAVQAPTVVNGVVVTSANVGTNKISNYGVGEYARLYPGFDGVAANGLKYGASLEIRQDNTTGSGGGVYGGVSQSSRARNALYFRRSWGYIGSDNFGTVRLGAADGPTTLYLTGTFENYDTGSFQSDISNLVPGANQINWPFPDAGGFYSNTKIVYLSPQFYGFDGGVSFEPSTATGGGSGGPSSGGPGCNGNNNVNSYIQQGSPVPTPGCDSLSSTSTGDFARRRNTYEALVRYRGTFGPIGLATTASFQGSSRVLDTSGINRIVYRDLLLSDFGLVLTYGGLQFGGNAMYGHFNTTGAGAAGNNLAPKGAPMSLAYTIGASYAIGPVIFGASYVDFNTPGDTTAYNTYQTRGTANQRREQGINVGGTYTVAPGVSLFAQYQINQRKQNGFNFYSNSGANSTLFANPNDNLSTSHNKVNAQVFGLGSSFAW